MISINTLKSKKINNRKKKSNGTRTKSILQFTLQRPKTLGSNLGETFPPYPRHKIPHSNHKFFRKHPFSKNVGVQLGLLETLRVQRKFTVLWIFPK